MLSPFLTELFRNYFLTMASCHQRDVTEVLRLPSEEVTIDCFAHLPALKSWILCWSNTGPASVNRVFISDTARDFAKAAFAKRPKVKLVNFRGNKQSDPADTDLTLLLRRKGAETVAYVPLVNEARIAFGIIRIVANAGQIRGLGFAHNQNAMCFDLATDCSPPDANLIAHILGRWGGNLFSRGDTQTAIALLLRAFSSFFTYAHDSYYQRDFESDELKFHHADNQATYLIRRDLKAPIHGHDHMFSIVAERGASVLIKEFPEALPNEMRINAADWKPTPIYRQLLEELGTEEASYIGIPIKVDDVVIGVVTMLIAREEAHFVVGARFARSTLSELGKTVDKSAISRTAHIIRQFATAKLSVSGQQIHLPTLGRELVEKLIEELLPFGEVQVGSHETRLGAGDGKDEDIDEGALGLIRQQLLQTIVDGRISIHAYRATDSQRSMRGVILVPFPGALPFILSVTGPLALLTGRSLRAALEQLQSVLTVALAASEQLASGFDISNWRAHLALWAQVHDLKNRTASFNRPLRDLIGTSENGSHEDLRREVLRFKNEFATAVRDFEFECDRVLRGAEFRKLGNIKLYEVVASAWTVIRNYPGAIQKCQASFRGDVNMDVFTFESELKIVLENIFSNVIKHFQRTSFGHTTISASLSEDGSDVTLRVWDTIPEEGAVPRVRRILEDADSQQTLPRFVKPIVERLLQGYIWAEEEPNTKVLVMVLKIPRQLKTH